MTVDDSYNILGTPHNYWNPSNYKSSKNNMLE